MSECCQIFQNTWRAGQVGWKGMTQAGVQPHLSLNPIRNSPRYFLHLFLLVVMERKSYISLPYDHIHDETVAQQADYKHHRVDRGDDGDDRGHPLLLPAPIVGHVAAVGVFGHPGWEIQRTVLRRPEETVIVCFQNFHRGAFHGHLFVWVGANARKKQCILWILPKCTLRSHFYSLQNLSETRRQKRQV